jgi:GT2 family glycosyltransferase
MSGVEQARSVSIVVPTFNNARLLAQCLDSLAGLAYPREAIEIVVADNGSTDGTAGLLSSRYPHVKHTNLGENAGFAAACNRGASEASGEYLAFLNDDATVEPGWLDGLFAGLDAGGEGAVCAASHIRSRDGREVEFSGASANLFGVGRPRSAWGWPGSLDMPGEGSHLLFASGGAMLIHRRTFLDVGGFDPHFFAYFEDVDLGWRLWVLGHKVVYAPNAVVRHVGGATGSRVGAHRRYALWECNSLAVILKNYESGNMERILAAALLLLYKRALLSAGGAYSPADYALTGPRDTNEANVEQLPKVSVAHLAAIDRFNSLLPRFMEERRRIQGRRLRSDAEILPLLGRAFEPQFAGSEYAAVARDLACSLDLYGLTRASAPNRVLVLASDNEAESAYALAATVKDEAQVAVALVGDPASERRPSPDGFALHILAPNDPKLAGLIEQADGVLAFPGTRNLPVLGDSAVPLALLGGPEGGTVKGGGITIEPGDDVRLLQFCREPRKISRADQG